MARFFHARHGKTHCPGGSDPIPCLGLTIGEAYRETDFSALTGGLRQITNYENWTIENPAVIDEAVNGLSVERSGYYLIDFACVVQGGMLDAHVEVYIGIPATGIFADTICGQQVADVGDSFQLRVCSPYYVADAPVTVTTHIWHNTGTSRTVAASVLKIVRLNPDPPVPYWV